jgi:hypothetical protein
VALGTLVLDRQIIIALAVAGVLLLGLIALAIAGGRTRRRLRRLEAHYARLMAGAEGLDMAAALDALVARADAATAEVQAMRAAAVAHGLRLDRAIQHVAMVRFNPFGDTGGDLSFALALADAHGDGALLCNLHGRGESRFYAKPLKAWQSPYPLSDEEQQALDQARATRDAAPAPPSAEA